MENNNSNEPKPQRIEERWKKAEDKLMLIFSMVAKAQWKRIPVSLFIGPAQRTAAIKITGDCPANNYSAEIEFDPEPRFMEATLRQIDNCFLKLQGLLTEVDKDDDLPF